MSRYASYKSTERRIARRLGGKRTGHLGGEDVSHDWLSVEVKHRRALPVWLKCAVEQAQSNADSGKLAIVVLHEHAQRQDLVILTLGDFIEWFGEP